MQARSALFDLYGDHLRSRGSRAPVAALVRLLAPLGIAAPAVRTAISRMVREGWLERDTGPSYVLTDRAVQRLDDAASRIYRTRTARWDGSWDLVIIQGSPGRTVRERLRAELGFLGYAPIGSGSGWSASWIAPRHSAELADTLASCGVTAERFRAERGSDPAGLVRRTWDLDALAGSYEKWLAFAERLVAPSSSTDDRVGSSDSSVPVGSADVSSSPVEPDGDAYARRCLLVHEWRKFLFRDPGLPRELLPESWPGDRAAEFFDAEAGRLGPAANRFVDACLEEGGS